MDLTDFTQYFNIKTSYFHLIAVMTPFGYIHTDNILMILCQNVCEKRRVEAALTSLILILNPITFTKRVTTAAHYV